MNFEEWFHEQDYFGPRSKRFFNDCELYLKQEASLYNEGEQTLLAWLKQAFEHGKKA